MLTTWSLPIFPSSHDSCEVPKIQSQMKGMQRLLTRLAGCFLWFWHSQGQSSRAVRQRAFWDSLGRLSRLNPSSIQRKPHILRIHLAKLHVLNDLAEKALCPRPLKLHVLRAMYSLYKIFRLTCLGSRRFAESALPPCLCSCKHPTPLGPRPSYK